MSDRIQIDDVITVPLLGSMGQFCGADQPADFGVCSLRRGHLAEAEPNVHVATHSGRVFAIWNA